MESPETFIYYLYFNRYVYGTLLLSKQKSSIIAIDFSFMILSVILYFLLIDPKRKDFLFYLK